MPTIPTGPDTLLEVFKNLLPIKKLNIKCLAKHLQL